jgi:hypothetical protein
VVIDDQQPQGHAQIVTPPRSGKSLNFGRLQGFP